jgi:hypothetical protein
MRNITLFDENTANSKLWVPLRAMKDMREIQYFNLANKNFTLESLLNKATYQAVSVLQNIYYPHGFHQILNNDY